MNKTDEINMQTLYFGFYFWLLPFHKQLPQQVVPHV